MSNIRLSLSFQLPVLGSRLQGLIPAAFLLPNIKTGMRILDAGCGPGSITVGLAGYAKPGEAVGIDQTDEVLDHARSYTRGKGVTNVRFEKASIYGLPFQDASFDVAYAHQILFRHSRVWKRTYL